MGIYSKDYINRTLLNEVYFGETKEIRKMQNLLSIIRKKCIDDSVFPQINSCDEIQEFNRLGEDAFGFKVFCFSIMQTPVENAFALPISSTFKGIEHKKYFAPTTTGMKYKKEANYCALLFITSGLFTNIKYSDREIMAILLHEIGHNFSANFNEITNIQQSLAPVTILLEAISHVLAFETDKLSGDLTAMALSTNTIRTLYAEIDKFINTRLKVLGMTRDSMIKFCQIIKNFNKFIYKTLGKYEIVKLAKEANIISKQIKKVITGSLKLLNPVNLILPLTKYDNEKLADNFPTMYGYGEDIGTAVTKLELYDKDERTALFDKIPIVMQIVNILQVPASISGMIFDCHPRAMERMLDQLYYLQRELDKQNLDPKMRKEISSQVKNIEGNINRYITNTAKIKDIKDPNYMTKCFYTYLQDTCDGDLKNFILDSNNYGNIEKMYQSKLEQVRFI